MAWRVARSLEVLTAEIQAVRPGTTVWTIGDQDHAETWSDHNPNAAGVVCAADILADAGLDLDWLAATVTATDPPALKYVIWNRRIWFPGLGWHSYGGDNPHTTHVHVSVGWGPDGRSTGPYDDTSPWGLVPNAPTEVEDMHRIRSGVDGDGSIYVVPGWRAPSGLLAAYGLSGPVNVQLDWIPLRQLPPGMSVAKAGVYDVSVGAWSTTNPPQPPSAGGGSGPADLVLVGLLTQLRDAAAAALSHLGGGK